MSITYVTQIERESADGTTAVLKDYTSYTSPARNALALFIKFVKRSAALVDTAITIDNSAPLSATEWTFNLAGDGWYYATIFGFPIWSAGTYTVNQCVYYSVTQRYYQAKGTVSSVPTNTTDWNYLPDPTLIELTATNVEINNTHNFTSGQSEILTGDQLEQLADEIIDGKPKDWEDTTIALLGLALLNGAWVKHYRVKNQQAQSIIDFIIQRYPTRI